MNRAESKIRTHKHKQRTSSIRVDLPPGLLDSFYSRFFGLCDVDGARRGLVEEILGVLPQGAVLHSDDLRSRAYG
jgi:hypothetical protein